jgi:hypothetical protein
MGQKIRKMHDSGAHAAILHDNFIYKQFWLGNLTGTYEFGHRLRWKDNIKLDLEKLYARE